MNNFSVKILFEDKINALWHDPTYKNIEYIERGYAVQDIQETNSILFVGINPSYSENVENIKYFFYNHEQQGEVHPYFKKFQEVSREIGLNWSHVDLLFLRETNQKEVEKIYNTEKGRIFFEQQLNISKTIIKKINPKIIVVSNTFARELFREKLFNCDFFDETLGTNIIINDNDLIKTPVFFTSMLTGQRALDLGSFKRLIWHINYILNKIKNGTN